jgi:hypothetical protein
MTQASIAAQHEQEVTNAFAAWQAAETQAWDAYQTALAAIPDAPALAVRIGGPPAAEQT